MVQKYFVEFQAVEMDRPFIRRISAFNLISLEKEIRYKIRQINMSKNKYWHVTGGYSYREYTKRDYLIDLIEDIIKNPEEINSEYAADEIEMLLLGQEDDEE